MPRLEVLILGYAGPMLPAHDNVGPCAVCGDSVFAVPYITPAKGQSWREYQAPNIHICHQSCFHVRKVAS